MGERVGNSKWWRKIAAREVKRNDLTTRLVLLKIEAGRLRLYKTMRAIDEATKVIGWERVEESSPQRPPRAR